MKDLIFEHFRIGKISVESGSGYAISFNDGVSENVCALVIDESGTVAAANTKRSASNFGTPFDFEHAFEDRVDARADVPWAFAMFGGSSLDYLLDKLNVPIVLREKIGDDLEELLTSASTTVSDIDERAISVLSVAPGKRLGALAFYSGDTERAVIRRQAAEQYPLLADLLTSNLSAKMAIDRKKPLVETVTVMLAGLTDRPITKPILKRVAAAGPLPEDCDIETVIRFMSLVPVDWVPSNGDEWNSFCHSAHALLTDLKCKEEDIANLTKGCSGKWTDFCSRITKKAGFDDEDVQRAARRAMFNAADMIDCFADVALLPMAAHASPSSEVMVTPEILHTARGSSFEMLLSGRNAPDVADVQRRWHQERATVLAATEIMREERRAEVLDGIEGTWPGITAPVQAPNGLWLIPLTTPGQLVAEGMHGVDDNGVEGLHHCVGGYASRAEKCDCHIVSVRKINEDGSYKRISTVEFNGLRPDSNMLTARQNMATGNTTPSAESKDAVSWFINSVENGHTPLNREQISAFLDREDVPDDGVERICGYNWQDAEILLAGITPWGSFVVPEFRKLNLNGLMDTPQVRGVTELMPPEILLSASR